MKRFIADLHIHSRFSRATSKALAPRHLSAWAHVKGIDVLGTGDITHPEWLQELKDMLTEDPQSGMYVLKDPHNLADELDWLDSSLPERSPTRFILQGEISSIYKRGGKVRKVHNLVYFPDFESAERFNQKLAQVGNLVSDGRPILGLDSRNLLEMVLETHPQAYLIPAHIWTPWFSLFGSKSGFDAIEECFGDLSRHIFALETGLSSDPEMNWMLSALDRFRLISNSDAHSGEKLGREVNLFSGEMSYEGIYRCLRGEALGQRFQGTVEFFPEEGKYHLDGHRKCGVVMEPRETLARNGICPVCGKPLTVGVLNRVLALADRDEPVQPQDRPGFSSLIPLTEISSEIVGTGPGTKKVKAFYSRLIHAFGSEFTVLRDAPLEDLAKVSSPLAEGVGRMRKNEVIREPGFDGQFGVIRVFSDKERQELKQGRTLVGLPSKKTQSPRPEPPFPAIGPVAEAAPESSEHELAEFNPKQAEAVAAGPGPVLVIAGPGTGKTRTLIGRVAALLDKGENPRRILAVTFTRKAAKELHERLVDRFGESTSLPRADTLHGLAFDYWKQAYAEAPVILNEEGSRRVFSEANPGLSAQELKTAWNELNLARERRREPDSHAQAYHAYVKLKESWNLADYTDLLEFWLEQIQSEIYTIPFTQILVDEVQDLSPLQLEVIKALVPEGGEGFFAIGDPDQSIYGFRGALTNPLATLREIWPELAVLTLSANYRSAQSILDVALSLFSASPDRESLVAHGTDPGVLRYFSAPTVQSEAAWIADQARTLLGSTSHSLADGSQSGDDPDMAHLRGALSPGDIAVLVRFRALMEPIRATLTRMGLPCAVPEQEAFWSEPRVAMILQAAGRFLGIGLGQEQEGDEDPVLSCPDSIIVKGPQGLAAYLQEMPPFDRLFWQGKAFKHLAEAYKEHGGWQGLLNWIHLQSELEMVSAKSEKIQIMSLHAAKGLEFAAVFLPALEDGILPYSGPGLFQGRPEQERQDQDEERRLFYVGMTRAKQALFLSRAAKRTLYGKELRLPESPLAKEVLEAGGEAVKRSTLSARTKTKEQHLTLM
ncbi:MAG: DNA helicase UvrD [Desulfovibrio sp.]|nr:MAG: DNA helicase UvrD [Desulfovibrio sp.]